MAEHYEVGDIVKLKKPHPCGSSEWEILRVGADFRLKCTGCGQCAARCPLNNITLREGKPVWGKHCTHCMACLCYCPEKTIEYGTKSRNKPRYHFEALGTGR